MNPKLALAVRCAAASLAVVALGSAATAYGATSGSSSKGGAHSDSVKTAASPPSQSHRCHTGDLRYAWDRGRPDMDADYQQIAVVRLTNKSGHTCILRGYPGIQLIGKGGEKWDLPRAKDKPDTITLHPGDDTALATFNLLPIPAGTTDTRPLIPRKVLITPPNETTHTTLDWPYGGAIWHQAGKPSDPETFVNPISVG